MTKNMFFEKIIKDRSDSEALVDCMKDVVQNLLDKKTSVRRPGILLGKIQGGKTRAFIGIIGLAFDSGYDLALVLTKGTKALARQTVRRLESDFASFIDSDQARVYDIMQMPDNLTSWELNQKLIIVAKKEVNNMRRVIDNLVNVYPDLSNKRILIIDDEADYASVSFRRYKDAIEIGRISSQIDELRRLVADIDYLQVTATPYSLYLQPDMTEGQGSVFLPKRPSFTVLLPIHSLYIGGDFYFTKAENGDSIAQFLFEEVPAQEREVLKVPDRRKFKVEKVLTDPSVFVLRHAIMNFIVGANIRRTQQYQQETKEQKYSFVAHSEISKASHNWQREVIEELVNQLKSAVEKDAERLDALIQESYRELSRSLEKGEFNIPEIEQVKESVCKSISEGHIMITVVNSEKDAEELLDESGQLHLRTPLNIFIGGQILDRGITIKNLIGFYYGRNPKRFQQDTVLQHSRMYGARDKGDIAVTRFYTTHDIYYVMKLIHEFDTVLREAFEKGGHRNGVYFVRKDASGKLAPCSPNKLVLSKLTSLKPYKRMLPYGFQTDYKTKMKKKIQQIDTTVKQWGLMSGKGNPHLVPLDEVLGVIDLIGKTFTSFEDGYEWDIESFKASIEHLSRNAGNKQGKVWVLVRTGRNLTRVRPSGRFFDAPDTSHVEGKIAKEIAIDIPILMLFRVEDGDGWRGAPFWWPVLMAPKNTPLSVFASKTLNEVGVI